MGNCNNPIPNKHSKYMKLRMKLNNLQKKNTNHSLPRWWWSHVMKFPHIIIVGLK